MTALQKQANAIGLHFRRIDALTYEIDDGGAPYRFQIDDDQTRCFAIVYLMVSMRGLWVDVTHLLPCGLLAPRQGASHSARRAQRAIAAHSDVLAGALRHMKFKTQTVEGHLRVSAMLRSRREGELLVLT